MKNEEKVWACICRYNTSAATALAHKGWTRKSAVLALAGYAGRTKYHGHLSGAPGDGQNQGADTNRTEAIAFLNEKDPPEAPVAASKDHQKEADNREHMAALMDIVTTATNFGDAEIVLALTDPNWKTIRGVEAELIRLKAAKKKK